MQHVVRCDPPRGSKTSTGPEGAIRVFEYELGWPSRARKRASAIALDRDSPMAIRGRLPLGRHFVCFDAACFTRISCPSSSMGGDCPIRLRQAFRTCKCLAHICLTPGPKCSKSALSVLFEHCRCVAASSEHRSHGQHESKVLEKYSQCTFRAL